MRDFRTYLATFNDDIDQCVNYIYVGGFSHSYNLNLYTFNIHFKLTKNTPVNVDALE